MLLGQAFGHAAPIQFVTNPNNSLVTDASGSHAENASVTFITSLNQLEISVTNLQAETDGDIQTINAIDWLLTNPSGPAPAQPTSVTLATSGYANLGYPVTITKNGVTPVAGGLAGITSHWALYTTAAPNSSSAGAQITGGTQLTTISGGSPTQTIIGDPPYRVNGSITNHNPFLETGANLRIVCVITFAAGSNVTADTTVSQARLSFGTMFATGQELDLINSVPEPSPVALLSGGMTLLLLLRRRPNRL